MLVIGLIGGIASGKSFIASCFHDLGASVLNADELGHRVLEQPDVVRVIQNNWPTAVDADGKVSRSVLAEIVFRSNDRCQLNTLERITHPRISELINIEIVRLRKLGCPAVVLDAPVMVEAGWASKCDKIVFIDSPLELRQKRALARGWTADELGRRELAQLSLSEKRSLATDSILNGTDPEKTRFQCRQLWNAWGLVSNAYSCCDAS